MMGDKNGQLVLGTMGIFTKRPVVVRSMIQAEHYHERNSDMLNTVIRLVSMVRRHLTKPQKQNSLSGWIGPQKVRQFDSLLKRLVDQRKSNRCVS